MLLDEVLGLPAWCGDERLGFLIDARFVLTGVPRGQLLAPAELVGFIVGPRRGAAFLGYERNAVNAPAVLAALLRHRQAGAFLLALDDIEAIDESGVHARVGYARWSASTKSQRAPG